MKKMMLTMVLVVGLATVAFGQTCRDPDNDGDCDLTNRDARAEATGIVHDFRESVPPICIGKLGIRQEDFDRLRDAIAQFGEDVQAQCEATE